MSLLFFMLKFQLCVYHCIFNCYSLLLLLICLLLQWLNYNHTTRKLMYDSWYLYLKDHLPHSAKYVYHTLFCGWPCPNSSPSGLPWDIRPVSQKLRMWCQMNMARISCQFPAILPEANRSWVGRRPNGYSQDPVPQVSKHHMARPGHDHEKRQSSYIPLYHLTKNIYPSQSIIIPS